MKRKGSSSCLDASEKQCKENTLCYWVPGHGKQVGHCRSKPKRTPKVTRSRSKSRSKSNSAAGRSRSRSRDRRMPTSAAAVALRHRSRSRDRFRSRSRSRSRSRPRSRSSSLSPDVLRSPPRSLSRSRSRSARRSRSISREVVPMMHVPLYVAVTLVLGPNDFQLTRVQTLRLADHVMELFQMSPQYGHLFQWLFFTKLHENALFQFRDVRGRRSVLEFDLQMPASRFASKAQFLSSKAATDFVHFMKNDENPDTLEHDYITGFMRDSERKYGDAQAVASGVVVALDYRLGSPIVLKYT